MKKILSSKSYRLAVWAILALAFLLRLPLLNGSFWLDEAAQALESTRSLGEQLNITADFQPPLYHLAVFAFAQISHLEWWLRLASVIPSLITLWITIKLSRQLLGPVSSLAVGGLLATSQFFIYYSQELRPYSLSAMWGMLAIYLIYQSVNHRDKLSRWLIVVNALGLLTVYTYIFALLGQLILVAFAARKHLKYFCLYLGLSFILCLWWLPFFAKQFAAGQVLQTALSGWSQVVSSPLLKALPLTLEKFILGRVPTPHQIPGLIIFSLTVISGLFFIFKSWLNRHLRPLTLYFLGVLVSVFVVNFFIPLLDPKRLLFILPVMYLLLVGGLRMSRLKTLIWSFFILVNCLGLLAYWTNPDLRREPWRTAVSAIELEAPQNSRVVFAFTAPFAPWAWYQTRNLDTISTGYLAGCDLNSLDGRLYSLLSVEAVYVFDYLTDLTDPKHLVLAWLEKSGFKEASFLQYPGLGKIRVFTKANPFAFRSL